MRWAIATHVYATPRILSQRPHFLLRFLDIAMKMGLLRQFWGIAQRAFPSSGGTIQDTI